MGSATNTKDHGWVLAPEGADAAIAMQFFITSTGMGVCLKDLVERRLLMMDSSS
jgi:hypothetical protein